MPQTPQAAIHPTAVVESPAIGEGTTVGCFSHVAAGVRVGPRCAIGAHVALEGAVTVEADVVIGSHVAFEAQGAARSDPEAPHEPRPTLIRRAARIGSQVALAQGVVVGMNAVVNAGAVVTRDIPPNAVVAGNPASIVGYRTALRAAGRGAEAAASLQAPLKVAAVTLHKLPIVKDIRGTLSAGEFDKNLPFAPKRYFIVYEVTDHEVRGEHAHRALHQFLVCVKGSVSLVVDDGHARDEILLDTPGLGVHVPPMIWATQYKYSRDAVLLVLASEAYDNADYIRDYDEYLAALRGT